MTDPMRETTPKKRKAPAKQQAKKLGDFQFSNINLSSEDKRTLGENIPSALEMFEFMLQYVDSAYKFSWALDLKNDRYIASLTGREPSSENYQVCLTASGATPENALAALMYKVTVYCPDGVFPTEQMFNQDDFG